MEERKGFGTTFGFLMAAVGSAVGLGNIWGFPNKMGANGGFTFLVIYLILAACCGFIVMMGELALGRKTGRGVISTYKILTKRFKWLGWLGIIAPFLILSFYCALGGYCIKYVTVNLGNLFNAGFGTGGLGGALLGLSKQGAQGGGQRSGGASALTLGGVAPTGDEKIGGGQAAELPLLVGGEGGQQAGGPASAPAGQLAD